MGSSRTSTVRACLLARTRLAGKAGSCKVLSLSIAAGALSVLYQEVDLLIPDYLGFRPESPSYIIVVF